MSCLIALLVAAAGADQDRLQGQQSAVGDVPSRAGLHVIEKRLSSLLKQEAVASTRKDRTQAVCDLVLLYQEISKDGRLATSEKLNRLRNRLRSRLRQVGKKLRREIARIERPDRPGPRSASRSARHSARKSLHVTSGGQPYESRGSFGGGLQLADNGQALVDLIQRTIAPDTWDVNGGPSTIVYYAPRYALVVRAPAEIQRSVAGGLGGLRRAGP